MTKTNVLKDAQDFVVIRPSGRDSYVYAAKPSLNIMKEFYEQSISNLDDKNIDTFNRYWEFDEKRGIKGSSILLALRFDRQALRPNGLWIPGLLEAKVLDSQGKLENEVYRDYGIVIHNDNKPNKQGSKILVPQAKELDLKLPLVVPFRALDYVNDQNKAWGIKLSFYPGTGIIQGKEAQNKINLFDYSANSYAQGLSRDEEGDWGVWYDLADSGDNGRVDWVCGEATSEILEEAYFKLNEKKYGKRIRELREEQKSEDVKFIESLKR